MLGVREEAAALLLPAEAVLLGELFRDLEGVLGAPIGDAVEARRHLVPADHVPQQEANAELLRSVEGGSRDG